MSLCKKRRMFLWDALVKKREGGGGGERGLSAQDLFCVHV